MKRLHLPSYLFGLGCGIVLLFIGTAIILDSTDTDVQVPTQQQFRQNRDGSMQRPTGGFRVDDTERTERMAEMLGLSVEELQQALDSGKTMTEIAEEQGVELPFGRPGGDSSESGATMQDRGQPIPSDVPADQPPVPAE